METINQSLQQNRFQSEETSFLVIISYSVARLKGAKATVTKAMTIQWDIDHR